MPVTFVKELSDVSGVEDQSATFDCEISKAKWKKTGLDVAVKWFKGEREIKDMSKYTIRKSGVKHSLVIKQLMFEDVSDYSAVVLEERTKAKLNISEGGVEFTSKLKDVEVDEKETAQFDCEVNRV